MPVTDPTKCPVCNYDLRGLPIPHRCPECGFAYDGNTRIWRPGLEWRHYVYGYLLGALVIGTILALLSGGPTTGFTSLLLLVPLLVALGKIVERWMRLGRISNRFVAITPRGLLLGVARENEQVPIEQIRAVKGDYRQAKLLIVGRVFWTNLDAVFENAQDFRVFREAIQTAAAQASSSLAATSNTTNSP